jgi:hypothetical protein
MEELKPVLDYLVRPGSLTVMVAVYLFTLFTKRVVQTWKPSLKAAATEMAHAPMYTSKVSMWWNEVALSAMPVVYGTLFGIKYSEFLHGAVTDLSGRLALCAGLGWFSGFGYKVVRKAILAKTGVDIAPESAAPPPPDPPAAA